MKILHVYKTFLSDGFGGIEQVIAQLVSARRTPAFQHTIASLSPNPEPKIIDYHGSKHLRYKQNLSIASNSISLSLLANFRNLAQQADVIHYQFPWPFADVLHLLWRIKKPSILTYQSDIVRQKRLLYFYKPLMQSFLSKVNKIVATSPNYVATSPILQKFQDKVSIIPNGLNQQSYPMSSQERLNFWRDRFGERFFLFAGVLRYYKGLHILLNAVQGAQFPVLILGTGPLQDELLGIAQQLNLQNVHFLGALADEDKIALLQLCSGLVFPSHLRAEAFGMSLLEGALFAKPLISAEIGTGTSYININGKTGLVVPPNDAKALRNAMQFIWDNPKQANIMGVAAQARYKELFTADKMVAEYEKLYLSIV